MINIKTEILVAEGHKNCNKIMKPLIDILKSVTKDSTSPFIDLSRKMWITKFNNTFVEMSLENIGSILDTLSEISETISGTGIYNFDLKELADFRRLIEAPKKEFEYIKVFLTEDNKIGLSVSVKSKVSTNSFSMDLLLIPSKEQSIYGLPTKYLEFGFRMELMNSDNTTTYVLKDEELDDFNDGLVITIQNKGLIIARMMKNILYKNIKSSECIIEYMIEEDNTAFCTLSYESYTASNPPIKIRQLFTVYPYTDNTDK